MSTAIIKPKWSFVTIALMVLGFMTFWPIGLAILAYILWGEYFGGSALKAERAVDKARMKMRDWREGHGFSGQSTGNATFDAYRAEQLARLEAERQRLDAEAEAFADYVRHLRMARDREEFDRFMRDRRAGNGGNTGSTYTA